MRKGKVKAQSPLELFLTYWWAFVIAIFLVSGLYLLGVFNTANFTATEQPSSCQLVRLVGSIGSSITFQGTCSGELPKYVASFNPLLHNTSVIGQTNNNFPYGDSGFSLFAWINTISGSPETVFSFGSPLPGQGIALRVLGNKYGVIQVSNFGSNVTTIQSGAVNGSWHFIGVVNPAGTNRIDIFFDGQWTNGTFSNNLNITRGRGFQIGRDPPGTPIAYFYLGQISNVQIYNASLPGYQVEYLWYEGIGGAPVDPGATAGWWPLNGNAGDYSINNLQSTINNVTFINTWQSSYTAPGS